MWKGNYQNCRNTEQTGGCQRGGGDGWVKAIKRYKIPSSYKINKFWGYYVQRGDSNEQYCTVYLKVVKRIGLK